jgi:copper transport protein
LLTLVGGIALSQITALSASAHAVLESSTPLDGSTLATAPREVVLRFDEAVQLVPGAAVVISTAGTRIDADRAHLSATGRSVIIPLVAHVGHGSYLVTWRVVSADTHVVSGSIRFGVGQAPSAAPATALAPADPLAAATDTAQGFAYLGLILVVGVPAALLAFWPGLIVRRRARRLVWLGWAISLFAGVAEFLLQGPTATGAGWAGIPALSDSAGTLASTYGQLLVGRTVLLLLLIPVLRVIGFSARRGRERNPAPASAVADATAVTIGAAIALAVITTVALAGHAGVGADALLAVPAAALHLAAMCLWIGGLIVLGVVVLPSHPLATEVPTLGAWPPTSFICVAVLIVTGEYQAWRQVQPIDSLWSTSYGIALLVKIALVVAALAVAVAANRATSRAATRATNRAAVVRAATRAADPLRTLRRAVAWETAFTLMVVAATSVLVSLPPARTTYGPPETLSAPLASDTLTVAIDTTLHGTENISVQPQSLGGSPRNLRALSGTLSSASAGISALDVTFRRPLRPDSKWVSTPTAVPLAGVWTLALTATTDNGSAYVTSVTYRVW